MLLFVPYSADVGDGHRPVANYAIIAITVLCFTLLMPQTSHGQALQLGDVEFMPLLLDGWSLDGLVGHILLHADWGHLLGNMLFLWVFGNAVCTRLGNYGFPIAYLGLGVFAGIVHLICDGTPSLGASGAVNGVAGMFLVLYPTQYVRCFGMLGFLVRRFLVRAYVVLLLFFGLDVFGMLSGSYGVAHWAHIGGFLGGVALAVLLLKAHWVESAQCEATLLNYGWFGGLARRPRWVSRIPRLTRRPASTGRGSRPGRIGYGPASRSRQLRL